MTFDAFFSTDCGKSHRLSRASLPEAVCTYTICDGKTTKVGYNGLGSTKSNHG